METAAVKIPSATLGEEKKPLGATWYHVSRWDTRVEEFTVTKKTSATVWFKQKDYTGRETNDIRQARIAGEWFATRREALMFIRARLERSEEYTRSSWNQAKDELAAFNAKHAGELG